MVIDRITLKTTAKALAASAVLCLSPSMVFAADSVLTGSPLLINETRYLNSANEQSDLSGNNQVHPGTPMVLDPITGAFEFDLGGSETQKLQLQLSHPLTLESGTRFQSTTSGSNLLGLDATLTMPLGKGFNLRADADQISSDNQFQTLGRVQCMNGTLGTNSYTASGCRFVNDQVSGQPASKFDRRQLSIGASQDIGSFTSAVSWFTSKTKTSQTGYQNRNRLDPSALLIDNRFMVPFAKDNLLSGESSRDHLSSEATGIDLSFQLGFATSQAGEIRLGLAMTRVLDANFQSLYSNDLNPLDWSVAEPFDSAAIGLQWNRGSFSSGVRGFYREPVNFLNRETMDSMSTFDVHFTWRAPWNANLSVGASNVLGSGVSDRSNIEKPSDRYESIYGRIPYVRYQQDL